MMETKAGGKVKQALLILLAVINVVTFSSFEAEPIFSPVYAMQELPQVEASAEVPLEQEEETYVPILMYHNINDQYDPANASVEMSEEDFREQMETLKEAGYTTITFEEYLDYENGLAELPDKPIMINFDDGYLNNYTRAYPILKELGMKATIFVITGRMGMSGGVTYPHFTWEQAKIMEDSGVIDIESHTNFHNNLKDVSLETAIQELRKSKYLIQKNLGKDATVLAYPYGDFTEEVKQAAKDAGYLAAVKVKLGNPGVNRKGQDVYELKRLTVYGGMTGEQLLELIQENKDW